MPFPFKISSNAILVIVLLLSFDVVFAQHNPTESVSNLKAELEVSTGIERAKKLQKLGMMERFNNPNNTLAYAYEALSISKQIKNDSLIFESYYYIGLASILKGDLSLALEMLLDARQGFERLGLIKRKISTGNVLAGGYIEISEFEKAIEIYQNSLSYSKETNNLSFETFYLMKIGVVFFELGEYSIAKEYLKRALKIAEETDNWRNGILTLTELGNLENTFNESDSAAYYYQKAIDWSLAENSMHSIPSLLSTIGDIYKDQEKLSEAFEIQKRGVEISDSLNNSMFAIYGIIQLSVIKRMMGDFEEAIRMLDEASDKMSELSIKNPSRFNYSSLLAENYLQLGNYQEASRIAEEFYAQAKENSNWLHIRDALNILIAAKIEQGLYRDVVEAQQLLIQANDSIVNQESLRNLQEFDAKYNLSRKEQEIALLEAENQKKAAEKAILIIVVISILFIAFLIIRSQLLKNQKTKIRYENEELKRRQLEQDLEFKNKQMVTQSLNILQKKELMLDMKDKVEKFKEEGSVRELSKLSNQIDYSFTLDKDWEDFKLYFEEVHVNFYNALKVNYEKLTPNELKLSALIKLNLSIKETASILGISPDSVKKARYRLRKKLELDTEDNLVEFMLEIERDSISLN